MIYAYTELPAPNWRDRLNEALDDGNVSAVARGMGISPQAIYKWQDGSTKAPDKEHWLPLAKLLNVNVFWLFMGCGQKGDSPMNSHEVELIHKYRKLLPAKQAQLKSVIDGWLVDEALSSPTARAVE